MTPAIQSDNDILWMFYTPQTILLTLLIRLILVEEEEHIHEHQYRFSSA